MGATNTGGGEVRRSPALDGLRALAVGAVIGYHGHLPFASGGFVGVDIFFVLSGFLITGLLIRERSLTGTISLREFWIRRARRLLPSLAFVSSFLAIAFSVDHHASNRMGTLVGIATGLAYLNAVPLLTGWWGVGWMSHEWSLSVEELFYVIFPLCVMVLGRARASGRWIYMATLLALVYTTLGANVLGWSFRRVYFAPDTRAQQLLLGCSLAVFLSGSLAARWHRSSGVLAWVSLLVLGLSVLIFKSGSAGYAKYGSTMVALCSVVIVWHCVTMSSGLLARLLSCRQMVWIGRRSYTIYLIHAPLFGLIPTLGSKPIRLVVIVGISVVYSGISYRFLESRFLAPSSRQVLG